LPVNPAEIDLKVDVPRIECGCSLEVPRRFIPPPEAPLDTPDQKRDIGIIGRGAARDLQLD
jgi:hypothetical protein